MNDDWTLTTAQLVFFQRHMAAITQAFADENTAFLRELAATPEYLAVFGDMGFDEAYDRYETMLEDEG